MKGSENSSFKSLEGSLKCFRIRLTYFNVTVKSLKKTSCVSDYSYPLSFLLRGCVREVPCFCLSLFLFLFFFSVNVYERDTSLFKKELKEIGWDHRAGSPRVVE